MTQTLPSVHAPDLRHRLYVTPAWPDGFCPLHFGNHQCGSWCFKERLDFAAAAFALQRYWQRLGLLE
jgi:hypothetical protein